MTSTSESGAADYVFLICSERSGSNLISTMLGAHSRIKSPPPYHFARDVALNLHRRGAGWGTLRAQLLERVQSMGPPGSAERLASWLDAHPQAPAEDLARCVYEDLDSKPGTNTVFVKENNLHRLLHFVLTCFPTSKFVFQVRDPRDFLASAQARRDAWGGNKFGSVRRALEVWRDDQLGGLQLLGLLGPERVYFQRYEDLVSRPRDVLEPLCRFLGQPFEHGMLDFHTSEDAVRLAATATARANVARPLTSSSVGRYRADLSSWKIRAVETWLGDLMDRFGYPRDLVRQGRSPMLHVAWPWLSEPIERLINGETEPFYRDGQKRMSRALRAEAEPVTPPYDAPVG